MSGHAFLSASSAHRWLNCAMAPHAEKDIPDEESDFALAGTLCHEYSEILLTGVEAKGRRAEILAHPLWDASLQEAAEAYVAYARGLIGECSDSATVLVEAKLDFSYLVPDGYGTGDLVTIDQGLLTIVDLKAGKGVEVSAVENEQMSLYALGALDMFEGVYDISTVRMVIFQPRRQPEPSVWTVPVADLLRWGDQHVTPRALLAFTGNGTYTPGNWCGFCRARFRCRARAEANLAAVQGEFTDRSLLSDGEIAALLAVAASRQKWYADLQSFALEAAEKSGKRWPGFKLVAGRSNRKYLDEDRVVAALHAANVEDALIYDRSLVGITAMEKNLGKARFTEVLGDLIVKPKGKPTLVPEKDPRPEIEGGAAIDGFEMQQPALTGESE